MSNKLTPKQEKFAQLYVELGNAAESYRQAYNTKGKTADYVHVKASEVLNNGKVAVRVKELQKAASDAHGVTVKSLMEELDEARMMAKNLENPNAMTSATMGKAKIAGLDKQVIEHSGSIASTAVVNVTIAK